MKSEFSSNLQTIKFFCFSWFWNWANTLKMISEWAINLKNEMRWFSSVHNKNQKIDKDLYLMWNRKKRRICMIYFSKTNLLKKIKEQYSLWHRIHTCKDCIYLLKLFQKRKWVKKICVQHQKKAKMKKRSIETNM